MGLFLFKRIESSPDRISAYSEFLILIMHIDRRTSLLLGDFGVDSLYLFGKTIYPSGDLDHVLLDILSRPRFR